MQASSKVTYGMTWQIVFLKMLLNGVQEMLIFRYLVESRGVNLRNEEVTHCSLFHVGLLTAWSLWLTEEF